MTAGHDARLGSNRRPSSRSDQETLASAFAVYTAIATAFSSSLISFLKPCPLGAIAKTCCKFSHVGASFQLALAFDKMKSCRHKRYRNLILDWFRTSVFELWLQVFPCGCKFSNLHFPDKMKSCRHKTYGHLVLNGFRASVFKPWLQVFPCGCKFSNLHFPDKMKSCRHKTYGHLVLNGFRASVFELWLRVFPCGCKFSNLHFPDAPETASCGSASSLSTVC